MKILHACKHFHPRVTGVTLHGEHPGRKRLLAGHDLLALALAASLVAMLAGALPSWAVDVVPLDILTMIDPRSGQPVQARRESKGSFVPMAAGRAGAAGTVEKAELTGKSGEVRAPGVAGWRAHNAVWDGTAIRLAAARGETAAFQLMLLPGAGESLENIRIQVDLGGLADWRAYRAWHIWGVPEVAVPLGQGTASFDIPSRLPAEPALTGDFRAFATVVEFTIPRDQRPGPMEGRATVSWKGGNASLPLRVDVLPFALPEKPHFVLEMNSYGDFLRHLPGGPQALVNLHRLFRDFRCTFTLVPYRQDGTLVMECLAPAISPDGQPDFTAFDLALGGLFDGSAFADGQPLSHYILPFQANWPAAFGSGGSEYAARNVGVRQAFARHIGEKGWTTTRFQEFHNENPEHGARVPWRLDEPTTARDIAGHTVFLDYLARSWDGWDGQRPVRYRIDISNWRPLRGLLEKLAGRVPDWSLSADPAYLDSGAVEFFRRLGGKWLVAYGELDGFQREGASTPWAVFPLRLARIFLAGLDGYAQWQADCWKATDIPGIPAEAVPLFYSNASGARDFVWPGAGAGYDGPVPSLRLFALREGLNLLDYVSLASRGDRPEGPDGPDRTGKADPAEALRQQLAHLAEAQLAHPDGQGGARELFALKARFARVITESAQAGGSRENGN